MKRPRLTLSLFNPRRRLRDRLLAAMLVVALVPAAAFFVLVAIDLHGITQSTITGAVNGLVKNQENTFQTELVGTASTEINGNLQALQAKMVGLAAALATATTKVAAPTPSPGAAGAGTSGSPTAKASPTATSSPTVTASPAPSVNPAPTSTPAATNDLAYSEVGDGVWEVTNFSSPAAELLVGTTSGSESVQTRAEQLANLSPFADKQLADVAKVGSSVDAVWIMDQTDNAVWVSPGDVPVPQVQGLAGNPQGIPTRLLIGLGSSTPPPQTPAAAIQASWTVPYENLLQGNRWVVTVYAQVGEGLVVGADVPLAQFASQISDAPSETGSYPLLLGHNASSWNQVIAGSDTGKDFPGSLQVGGQLPRPVGKDGSNLLAALKAAETGDAGIPPIDETVGGVERLFFVAPVTTLSSDGWILVDSAPKAFFEPNKNALSLAISQKFNSIVQGAIWIVAILLLVSFLLATLLSRFMVAPVRALTASAERLAKGHTDERVPSQGRDEVGDLADSLERMRRELNASREVILAASRELEQKVAIRTAELSVRNEELLALNELAGSLTRSLDPEAILAGALEAVRAVLPTTAGRGFRIGRDGLMASRAEADDLSPQLEAVAVGAITGNQLITRADGDGVLIGLPMGTGAGPLGALGLRATVAPGAEMTALLMAIGNQVGLALSTARLSDEGREMAVLEERARLAREIHDTLAQQLTGIVIQLEAAQALVSRNPERSLPALASAQELARSALAEARRSVWDLRPAPLSSTGLVAAAESEVERFRRRTGIAARLRAEHMAPPPALRPQSEVTLLRITQQALANIAAHSGASRVTVRLRNLGDHVELTVKDNGHGFDTSDLPLGSFGIVGMAERARIAGGSFQVESVPGRGTTITVDLPVAAEAGTGGAPPKAAVPV
jgi:signal transduction histidine kinase